MMQKIINIFLFLLLTTYTLDSKESNAEDLNIRFNIISVSINSKELNAPSEAVLFYNTKTNKIYGNTGCNNYFGEFKQNENTITIFNVGSTRKLCDDNANEFEYAFLSVFSDEFEITNEGSDYFLESPRALIKLKQNS